MLPIGLQSCPSPSVVLLVIACLSRRASGSMRILHFTALALLASSACATPISSHAPLRGHTTTTSLPGIIPTSTDFTASAASDLPTFGTCRAFYYDPKDDVPCGVVARQFTIFLTYPEYDQPSTAQWCEVFLTGNGICRATSPNSPSAFPTSKPSTLSISTVAPTTDDVASATLTSASITTTSGCGTTSSPVAVVVSLHGSIISAGSASATTSTKTTSRVGVVLASVRASEYSETVVRTSSSAATRSAQAQNLMSNALLDAETNSSAATTFRPAIDTTRMVSYGMGRGNATSFKTVLVTAHLAADATAAVPRTTSGGVSSAANSTLAVRVLRTSRQASSLAFRVTTTSTSHQILHAEPTISLEALDSFSSTSSVHATATTQQAPSNTTSSSAASNEGPTLGATSTMLQLVTTTKNLSVESASFTSSSAMPVSPPSPVSPSVVGGAK